MLKPPSGCYTPEMRVAAFLCALAVFPAAASPPPRWLKIESPNFELFTTAGQRDGREVARHFEQVRAFFVDVMRLPANGATPVRIVFFRSGKEYAPYAPNDFADAFYLGAEDRDYIVMKSLPRDQFPMAVHEYIHLLVKHSGIDAPVWFNEGLAELYSNLKPLGGKIQVGGLIEPHFVLLQHAKWIDLATLLAARHDSPLYNEKLRAGMFYAESWALVHMLYLGSDYQASLPAFLKALKSGVPTPEIFAKVYGKSVPRVQQDLQSYLRGAAFNSSLFNASLSKEVDTADVSVSNNLEAGLVLAEILANTRAKAAEARQLYTLLARDHPRDWRVELGLARLSLRERQRPEAAAHYARAVDLGSTNARMYLDYGRLLRAADQRAEAVAILKRATEIDPENPDARLELAFACVLNDQHAEALAQFLLVKQVTPERAFEYFHAMAYSYYRLDRKPEARDAAVKCRTFAKSSQEMERADQLLTALNTALKIDIDNDDDDDDDEEPATVGDHADDLAVAEGTLRQLDCLDGKIRIRIGVGAEAIAFALLDLDSIVIKEHAPMNFTCGPQKPRRIRIEYQANPGAMPGTVGVVRTIAFPQ